MGEQDEKPPTADLIRRQIQEHAEQIIELSMRLPAGPDDQLPPADE